MWPHVDTVPPGNRQPEGLAIKRAITEIIVQSYIPLRSESKGPHTRCASRFQSVLPLACLCVSSTAHERRRRIRSILVAWFLRECAWIFRLRLGIVGPASLARRDEQARGLPSVQTLGTRRTWKHVLYVVTYPEPIPKIDEPRPGEVEYSPLPASWCQDPDHFQRLGTLFN